MRAGQWLTGLVLLAAVGCTSQAGSGTSAAPVSTPGSSGAGVLEVGQTVRFSISTHCGVESTLIDGRVWNAVEPLYATPERLGPPAGWGDPEQDGELTLEAPDRAVFQALGQRVVLVPSPSGQPLRACD